MTLFGFSFTVTVCGVVLTARSENHTAASPRQDEQYNG